MSSWCKSGLHPHSDDLKRLKIYSTFFKINRPPPPPIGDPITMSPHVVRDPTTSISIKCLVLTITQLFCLMGSARCSLWLSLSHVTEMILYASGTFLCLNDNPGVLRFMLIYDLPAFRDSVHIPVPLVTSTVIWELSSVYVHLLYCVELLWCW